MTNYRNRILRAFILVSALVSEVSAGAQDKRRFAYRGFCGGNKDLYCICIENNLEAV